KVTDTDKETERFQTARSKVLKDLSGLSDKLLKDNAKDAAEILEAHREILEDEAGFISPVLERIRENKDNAAYATAYVLNEIADMFRSIDNEYMRERAQDAEDLRDSINAYILGIKGSTSSEIKESGIITAFDLAPSDTAGLDVTKVAGLMTQVGGVTGHTAIMSRTMGIPAVVGINNLMEHVDDGVMAILDGDTGEVIIDPDSSQLEYYSKLQSDYIERKKELLSFKGKPTCTCDGHYVRLKANVGTADDVKTSASCDAEGIGLVRTEFLYMKRKELPTEQEQFDAYRSILNEMGKKPVIFRTLDAGGDKELPALKLEKEDNPFLGFRAIRICLKHHGLFKTQLKALLRASVYGDLRIMFPMISCIEEYREAKRILEEAKAELSSAGKPYKAEIPVGIMVEVPSAAIMADKFAREVDFFSIGTNDLVQYTLAADRGNPNLVDISTPYHPAVLYLISRTIKAAQKYNIPCGMCGEAAGDSSLIPLFIGLGLKEFSMNASSILGARKLINSLSYDECRKLAGKVMKLSTVDEVKRALGEQQTKL
ncbi:MAG: phosphoenolpyruvate--protein phosphotransferase, partial [Clostridiaceae bacterium]|nr:phosphoenolpyruvate--protein phosphotransferase [Clostridiaceae bacterium]